MVVRSKKVCCVSCVVSGAVQKSKISARKTVRKNSKCARHTHARAIVGSNDS
jgi:hypothetical protein